MDKAKKQKRKVKIIIILVVIVLMFLFRREIEPINRVISQKLLPIQSKIFLMVKNISRKYENIINYKYVLIERDELIEKNMFLITNQLQTVEQEKENERLRGLLELKKKDKKIEIAIVTFRDLMTLYEYLYVSKGKKNDITLNMVVLSGKNVIGRVIEVFEDSAKVEMLTNKSFTISSKTENGMMGIATGNGEYNNRIIFTPTLDSGIAEIGEIIVSSGISDIYPKGVIIGKIVEKKEDEISYVVEPCIDLTKVREVVLYSEKVRNEKRK